MSTCISIRYGKNIKITKCLSQLGMDNVKIVKCLSQLGMEKTQKSQNAYLNKVWKKSKNRKMSISIR